MPGHKLKHYMVTNRAAVTNWSESQIVPSHLPRSLVLESSSNYLMVTYRQSQPTYGISDTKNNYGVVVLQSLKYQGLRLCNYGRLLSHITIDEIDHPTNSEQDDPQTFCLVIPKLLQLFTHPQISVWTQTNAVITSFAVGIFVLNLTQPKAWLNYFHRKSFNLDL